MQGYTEMGDTSTTTVREALIHHEKNINAIRSGNSGTSFPADAVAGMRCYRTDENKEYIYDGKEWNELAKASDTSEKINNEITLKLDELSKKISKSETVASETFATKKQAGVPYQIQRNTTYSEGDVLTSPDLPPGYILVVTTAGTTGNTEPDWDSIRKSGGVVPDGTVAFTTVSVDGLNSELKDEISTKQSEIESLQNQVSSLQNRLDLSPDYSKPLIRKTVYNTTVSPSAEGTFHYTAPSNGWATISVGIGVSAEISHDNTFLQLPSNALHFTNYPLVWVSKGTKLGFWWQNDGSRPNAEVIIIFYPN